MARNQKDETFDAATQLKDAGLVAASAAAQVASANKILDMGAARFDARAIIDTSAVEVATGDEKYTILIQGSTSATFASGVWNLGATMLGDSSTSLETADTVAAGRREIAFCNEVSGLTLRYIRLYTVVAGTVATGINFTAWVVKKA